MAKKTTGKPGPKPKVTLDGPKSTKSPSAGCAAQAARSKPAHRTGRRAGK